MKITARKGAWILFPIVSGFYILIGISLYTPTQTELIKVRGNFSEYIIKYDKIFHKRSEKVKILIWTEFFDKMGWVEAVRKEVQHCNCSVTSDRNEIESADAVVFHLPDLWFYKTFYPKYRAPNQVWILLVVEPPPQIVPLRYRVPKMMFNWTMSYRRDSTIPAPYGKMFELTKEEKKNLKLTPSVFQTKTRFMTYLIGNCFDDARRYRKISELKKFVRIDEHGDCGDLICPMTIECNAVLNKYKFKIAFENGYCRDYVTEKFWNGFAVESIPVVNWHPNQDVGVPKHSYININDFPSIREAAQYMKKVAENSTLYDSYFDWKKKYRSASISIWRSFRSVCEKLHSKSGYQAQTIVDPWQWLQDDTCELWTIPNMLKRKWDRFIHDFTIFQ